jgi:type I restriction enzyme R subunit
VVTAEAPEEEPSDEEGRIDQPEITELPVDDDGQPERRKFYFDGGHVEIAAHLVYELDPNGTQLRVVTFADHTAKTVRALFRNAHELRDQWVDAEERGGIIERLAERGIDFDELAETAGQPEADPLDLLCHIAFNAPLRTRRKRAQHVLREHEDVFEHYGPKARQILAELLDKYTDYGAAQFEIPAILEVPPINRFGNVIEIAKLFGGAEKLRKAVNGLQAALYAA